MDMSYWRPTQGASGAMKFGECRKRTVNKILDTLKKHLPFTEYERAQELRNIAERVEMEIYAAATSQSEYTRKICFMMLAMETRLQNPTRPNSAASYNPLNLTANGEDWQEEVYQKIKDMKDLLEFDDWRAQLQADSRERIRNKILDTLKIHLPFSGDEGLRELKKVAVRFEDKIYTAATSQSDYLRKISLKMLTMENKSQDPMRSNSFTNSVNPTYPGGSQVMQQGQQLVFPMSYNNNIQQVMSESVGSIGMQGSSVLSYALPPDMESDNWRNHLQADSRERIKNKIWDTLKRHLPSSGGDEGKQELREVAERFEEKIYVAATSQSDYLRKISLKMLTVETTSQPTRQQLMLREQQVIQQQNLQQSMLQQQFNNVQQIQQRSRPTEGDWRDQLQADSRERIRRKIMDTLKRHLPFSGEEELNKTGERIEEGFYAVATSQSDYLRQISLKMLTMETTSQNPMSDPMQANSTANSVNP